MNLELLGKVAVVTGGASGIGLGMANAFLKEGCKVAICDINDESLAEAAIAARNDGYDIYAEKVDVTRKEELSQFIFNVIDHYGTIDIWVNNAGTILNKPIIDLEEWEWEKVIRVNLSSVFLGTQAAARAMIKAGCKGCIINTASINAVMPTNNKASYAASKAAVVSLTKSTAAELAPYGIRCNAILPGFIETKMMAARLATDEKGKLLSVVPSQKLGKPEDVANLCVFLASEKAHFITGVAYQIAGGMLCVQDPMTAWGNGW